jgi:chemotaxis protein MotB
MRKIVLVGLGLLVAASFLGGCASKAQKAEIESLRSQVGDLRSQIADLQSEKQEAEDRVQSLRDELRGFSEREKLQLEELNQCTILRIPNQLVFPSGSATLTGKGKNLLDQIADILQPYPDYEIEVRGFTDNKKIKPEFQDKFFDNWALSSARAAGVIRYLIDKHNMSPDRFSAVGLGEYHPIASNETAEGRAENRRVEFYISPPGTPIKPLEE